MSGSSASVAAEGVGFRSLFTTAQWQELEHQALIYKYLVAGQPIPHDLVVPIRLSFESISARLFHQSSGGYYTYFGKKIDPEPGRCRRTDGKKWRCSKDAYPSSKYCERHMHRGRNRSRKPVESQSTSQPLSTVVSANSSRTSSTGNGSFQNLPLLSTVNKDNSLVGTNVPKLQNQPTPYGTSNRENRYLHGLKPEVGQQSSGTFQVLGMEPNVGNSWNLLPSCVQGYESMSNHQMSRNQHQQQHCFLGSEIGLNESVKHETGHAVIRPFLDDWANGSSTTQLSMSVPTPPSETSTRNTFPLNDEKSTMSAAPRAMNKFPSFTERYLPAIGAADVTFVRAPRTLVVQMSRAPCQQLQEQ